MVKIQLEDMPTRDKVQPEVVGMRKPAWYKASQEDKNLYTVLLDQKLSDIQPPTCLHCTDVNCKLEEHTRDRDSYVLDVMCAIMESSHQSIPLSSSGSSSKKKTDQLPGWEENVAPAKSNALFWHSVWMSAGRPATGELHRLMAWTRNKYHYAVRKAKRLADTIKARNLIEAAEEGNAALMEEMKKTLNKKVDGQSVPECLDGKVTHNDILERFKECYEELYNSAGSEDAMITIKLKLGQLIKESTDSSANETEKLTGQVVKEACSRMLPGKQDVTGVYSSDVFLHAPDSLFDHLAAVFRSYLVHGTVTLQILCCAFLPLFKGGLKNPEVFDSYRAIAGASQLLKLFEYVIIIVWGDSLSSDTMQFGFKKGVSTTQCTWLVNEVATYFMRRGTAVNACLLDCSKAFDKCKFDLLFEKLLAKGLPAVVVRVLVFMYEEQEGWVKLGGKRSSSFRLTNGTRQGSVLSPLLFSVYLDDLLVELRKLQLGCHIGGMWYGACGYADDLILLAPTRQVLQQMLSVCESYGIAHNLVFSTDPVPAKSKTKCMLFCGRISNVKYPAPVKLDGKDLPWVEHAEHLGHTLHQSVTMEKDCLRAKARFIDKTVEVRDQLTFSHPRQKVKMVEILCCDGNGSML